MKLGKGFRTKKREILIKGQVISALDGMKSDLWKLHLGFDDHAERETKAPSARLSARNNASEWDTNIS